MGSSRLKTGSLSGLNSTLVLIAMLSCEVNDEVNPFGLNFKKEIDV